MTATQPWKAITPALAAVDTGIAWAWVRGTRLARVTASAARLTQHHNTKVRADLASHGVWKASPITRSLTQDRDPQVRHSLAKNPIPLSGSDVAELCLDSHPRVRAAAASRRDLPIVFARLLARDSNVTVRRILAINPVVDYTVLDILVYDDDSTVRHLTSIHPNAEPYHPVVVKLNAAR